MPDKRATYFMLKSEPMQREADHFRRTQNLPVDYARDRLHATVLPLPFGKLPGEWLQRIHIALAGFEADPITLRLNRFDGQALRCSAVAMFQRWREALKRYLRAAGIPFHDHKADPHVSLTYGVTPGKRLPVDPILLEARDLLLIESVHGVGHIELGRWPLIPRQGDLFR